MAPHAPAEVLLIEHATVLDGRGGAAIEDARVVVRGERIVAVEPTHGVPRFSGRVIDATGQFLLPGFIDMHAHLLFPRCVTTSDAPRFDRELSARALSAQLDHGVTTVRSPATPTVEGLSLRDDLNAGRVRGPRAYASAELINDDELSAEQLRTVVRNTLPFRPDYIKVYGALRPEQVAVVVDEAHRHALPVIGHLHATSWAEGLARGVDHLAHAVDWSVKSLPLGARAGYLRARETRGTFRSRIDWLEAFDPASLEARALLVELARRHVSVDVTLIAYEGKFSAPEDPRFRRNRGLAAFPELVRDWTVCNEVTADWTALDYARWRTARRKLSAWVKAMHDAGVLLVLGTDTTNEWVTPGDALHQEAQLLVEAGLSPSAVLRMMGANAAQALGRDDVGLVSVGHRADLVLLAADPRIDVSNTRSIRWVMLGGSIVAGPLKPQGRTDG
jgi:imidazolonepropionase-like amidohydrolase